MAALDTAKAVAAHWQGEWGRATTTLDAATAGTRAARGAWARVSAPAFREPTTREDTARLVAQVPALIRAGDALADSVAKLEDAAARARQAGDSAIAATARVAAVQDTLLDVVRHVPRVTSAVDALYDPINRVPAASLTALVRVAGRVAVIGRLDQRFAPGMAPVAYVGLHIRL